MTIPILTTKLYIPPPRPEVITRPRLIERLQAGQRRRLTLVSAAAGFGKTTLVSEWLRGGEIPAAWLALDKGDRDPARFILYLIAALQTVRPELGQTLLAPLASPQPPPAETILTALLNEVAATPQRMILVLDDYHLVEAPAVDQALAFLIEHLPPNLHLVVVTREDPALPLARLRARGQLTEIRMHDLRFTAEEAAEFLNRAMGLQLGEAEIAALEARTEGWIAGLQLAGLALRNSQADAGRFIQSFSGSHHYVLDYLLEEVLQGQPEEVQRFLLGTSILERLSGPLCEALLDLPAGRGQALLEGLARANLFILPLDDERRWYRYHHLFADLLRQRLGVAQTTQDNLELARPEVLHVRASQWFEDQGMVVAAFKHAAAAEDVERAERLINSEAMPLYLRGEVTEVLAWLDGLPEAVLEAHPALLLRSATLRLVIGQTIGVEERLQALEMRLENGTWEGVDPELVGRIAVARATLALTRYDTEMMVAQSRRALEYLPPDELALRATANWTLGNAYELEGDREKALQVMNEALRLSQAAGDRFNILLATINLGQLQELQNRLHQAAETYRQALELSGDQPLQVVNEAHLGLGRIHYQWNDLQTAEGYGRDSLHLAKMYESGIDRDLICEVFLAQVMLARGEIEAAAERLGQAEQSARRKNFTHRLPEIAAQQVQVLIRQGELEAAERLACNHELPLSQARVRLAQADPQAALLILEPLEQHARQENWPDELLQVKVLQARARLDLEQQELAGEALSEALALAEPGGFVRIFLDEGPAVATLLQAAAKRSAPGSYPDRLLAFFAEAGHATIGDQPPAGSADLIEPLSERELEVLQLLAGEQNGPQIAERLIISLNTLRTHTKNIYSKLGVNSRREAVSRARELGLV